MARSTFDEGVDACIAAVENLMERCVADEGEARLAGNAEAASRHKAHKVAYYDALTALEEIRQGADGCKIRFKGTRAERLQMYLLDSAAHCLSNRGIPAGVLPRDYESYDTIDDFTLAAFLGLLNWLKEQVETEAKARDKQIER